MKQGLPPDILRKIRFIQIQTTHLAQDVLAGAYRSAFKGRGMDFEEVRAYQMGDDPHSINWPVTARMNAPYIKIFREERDLTVLLIVDVSASTYFGSGTVLKKEMIAEIAAVLAFSAIRNHDRVGLILFSDGVEKYLPPKKGERHVLRVIRELLLYKPTKRGSNLKEVLMFLGKVQRKSSICFLVSDFLYPLCEHELSLAARQHDLIAIHVIDPREQKFPSLGLLSVTDLENGRQQRIDSSSALLQTHFQDAVSKQRADLAHLLGKIGASRVEIDIGKAYLPPLKKFFRIRGKQRL